MKDVTPGHNAITRLVNQGLGQDYAAHLVDTILEECTEPTRNMIEAGLDELNLALGKPERGNKIGGNPYRRDLVAVIWRAMLSRAR